MSESVKIKKIKGGSIINIQVGTGFYQRVQQMLFKHIADNPKEDLTKALENLKNKEASTDFEYALETLMSLIYEIESKAEEQGLNIIEEITPPENS